MIYKYILSFFFLLITVSAFSQDTKEEIQKKQQQLLKEISDLNNTLDDIKKNKKLSLGQLTLVQRKIDARQELISNINKDLSRLNEDMYQNELNIYRLKNELDTLKEQYAKSLVFAYKNRSNYDYLNFLFSANTFNDALKRIAYLKSYRQYRETQVSTITKTQDLLQNRIQSLGSNKKEKNNSLSDQSKQLGVLEDDKKEKDQVVSKLKGQEKNIASQIKTKEKTRQQLENALQSVIKKEIAEAKRKEQERLANEEAARKKQQDAAAKLNPPQPNTNTSTDVPVNKPKTDNSAAVKPAVNSNRTYSPFESTTEGLNLSLNFENNRGKLPWPVDQGYIAVHFGNYNVPNTKLKGYMPGLEISLPVGATVKSVAEGTVSAVFDLGNAQTVVIRHGKYFTAYSNMNGISVNKGDNVKVGTLLGKAAMGDDGDGQIIFMVSNDKDVNLNPESWLRSR
ncbi:MAG: peptidoglycan DD-metalloendopeptidase family protein [Chitinophagaceae bacterium]